MARLKSITAIAAFGLAVTACAEPTPQEQEADRIKDAAEAQADQIEAEADNRAAALESQAAEMVNASGVGGSYDAQMAKVRSDALKQEAELVKEKAGAQAKAVRDQGQAQASALLAQ